ncbi:MAG: PEP-CTERM sorting domain-containing protein, partial [Armatimonadetes bacterium]|nr:PEP-CTERM sorting domain-containing protein [Armatimonadota bacterium]
GTWSGNLTALNPSNGALEWTVAVGSKVYTSPAIGRDGSMFVMDFDGDLVKLVGRTPEPSSILCLASGIAAMFGRRWSRRRA